ncbi:MAG: protein kinase domain-containing protein, partial [Planctomycetota bacterium]
MTRLIVACPHCGARFDVSTFHPGSKIRCGACKKILRVPEEPATPAPSSPAPDEAKAGAAEKPEQKPDTPAPEPAPPPPPPPSKPEAPDPLIGHRMNEEFELVALVGQGGYGSVYEASDLTLERRVAVKLMLKEKTTSREFVEKFLREAKTAAQLSHPNIVKIHLVGFDRELRQHFLAMEYVEGKTLSDIMHEDGAFPIERAVDVITQSAIGLAEAHRKNIIHRDIKPGNIMITPKGVV